MIRSIPLACVLAFACMTGTAHAAAKTMRYRVLDATDQPLTVLDRGLDKGHWRSPGPVDASPLHVADFTLESESNAARGDTRWRIGGSQYLLKVHGNVDGPSADCSIQDTNRKDVTDSPYKCAALNNGGKDSDTFVVVQPKTDASTVLAAGQRRRQVYEALCGTPGMSGMRFTSCVPDYVNDAIGPSAYEQQSGDVLADCGPATFESAVTWTHTATETNTIGGSVGIGYESPGKLFESRLETSVDFKWLTSKSYSTGTEVRIPGQDAQGRYTYGWVDSAPVEQTVKADITAKAGNQTFVLPGVDVSAPLARTDTPASRRAMSTYLPAGFCTGTFRTPLERTIPATAPDPDAVYSLGIHGANMHVIRGGGGMLELTQLGDGRAPLWEFAPAPDAPGYYQLRSDADLDSCLTPDGTYAFLARCAGEPRQQFRLAYGDSTDRFQLQDRQTGRVLGVQSTDVGTKLVLTSAGSDTIKTQWEMNHA